MDFLQIVALALIQGLTEFLPISSSAHLIIGSALFGWQDQGTWFDLAVHFGSLCAVLLYFRQRIIALIVGWLGSFVGRGGKDGYLAWLLAVATIPAGIAGLLLEDVITGYARSLTVILLANSVFALILWVADVVGKKSEGLEKMTFFRALLIGCAQAVALIPGTSRSGITMSCALLLGFDRKTAAEFSFLLAIPLILAASLFQGIRLVDEPSIIWGDFLLGAACAAIAAYCCIAVFLRVINTLSMLPFVLYRVLLSVILLLFMVF